MRRREAARPCELAHRGCRSAGVGVSRQPPGLQAPGRRRHAASCPGQHRRLHGDAAARPLRRAGLASRGPSAAAADRGARPQAGRVRLRHSHRAARAPRRCPSASAAGETDDRAVEGDHRRRGAGGRGLLRGADAAPERPRGRDRGRAGDGGRRLVPGRCEDRRPRADRPARDRSAREPGAVREPRHALALHRLRAAGEHRARRRRSPPASPARRTAARSATAPT